MGRRENVSVMNDGQITINGILWIGASAMDEQDLLMDPRAIGDGEHAGCKWRCCRSLPRCALSLLDRRANDTVSAALRAV